MSSSNRREYLTATVLDQAFLDRCQDNLDNGLAIVVDIVAPDLSIIRASDRNKYVGGTFYEALTKFPAIKRSLGEWLQPQIEFSTLTLALSNVDKRFNRFLPGGDDFSTWLNKAVQMSIGLRDVASTYKIVFKGTVTDVAGVARDRSNITLISRDLFDRVNVKFPNKAFSAFDYNFIEDAFIGKNIPVIYGDWTTELPSQRLIPTDPLSPVDVVPIVPAFPLNGLDPLVQDGSLEVELKISFNANTSFDASKVYLKRGDEYYLFDSGDIINVNADNNEFSILQGPGGGTTIVKDEPYIFAPGDAFLVMVVGKDLGAYSHNIVEQAKDILKVYGLLSNADFDANWATYRDKASPAQSNIAGILSRVWVQDEQETMSYALSMLEQVRLEAFVSRDLILKLNSLHFEDFPATPGYTIRNWDVEDGTFNPLMDEKLTWNRAKGAFAFNPSRNENALETELYRNQATIDQTGKAVSKLVVFPNLYVKSDVVNQLKEMLRLTSNSNEMIDLTVSPRAFLLELGDFVNLNIDMGALVYTQAPAMIRDIIYNPQGFKIGLKLWSFQMVPYPGYAPTYTGITGGNGAAIIEET